jgi:Aminoglycoside-2''-adenylyltransferase
MGCGEVAVMDSDYLPSDAGWLFAGLCGSRWWIAGGWAIDLWLGRQTRPHVDLDVAVLRSEQHQVQQYLQRRGWDLQVAVAPGVLAPWAPGRPLEPGTHAVWCRPHPSSGWALELLFNDDAADCWLFRRDHRIHRPLRQLGMTTPSGIPHLRPEVVLLYKAKQQRPNDQADLRVALPRLPWADREWLANAIDLVHPGHPWAALARGST